MTPHEIKELRNALGLSQPEFLQKLGIKTTSPDAARQMISRWECGTRNPSAAATALLEKYRDEQTYQLLERPLIFDASIDATREANDDEIRRMLGLSAKIPIIVLREVYLEQKSTDGK
jgi:transcriptional regulator with XRE-family HTH domain